MANIWSNNIHMLIDQSWKDVWKIIPLNVIWATATRRNTSGCSFIGRNSTDIASFGGDKETPWKAGPKEN